MPDVDSRFDPRTFDPKSNPAWTQYKDYAGETTQGINNMPFVLGSANRYNAMSRMTDPQAFDFMYKSGPTYGGSGGTTGLSGQFDPQTLQMLLGLVNGGGGNPSPGGLLGPNGGDGNHEDGNFGGGGGVDVENHGFRANVERPSRSFR